MNYFLFWANGLVTFSLYRYIYTQQRRSVLYYLKQETTFTTMTISFECVLLLQKKKNLPFVLDSIEPHTFIYAITIWHIFIYCTPFEQQQKKTFTIKIFFSKCHFNLISAHVGIKKIYRGHILHVREKEKQNNK